MLSTKKLSHKKYEFMGYYLDGKKLYYIYQRRR